MATRIRFAHHHRLVLIGISFILFILVLYRNYEPKAQPCLPTTFKHWDKPSFDAILDDNEQTLNDGTVLHHRQMAKANPDVLILALSRDVHSWSSNYLSIRRRTVYDFLDMIMATDIDLSRVSLALMTASRDEFDTAKKAIASVPFARVALLYRESDGKSSSKIPYEDRHRPEVQRKRRNLIASARNYLMARSLQDETHVIWVDADIVKLSKGIVQTMIGHGESREDVGIITSICKQTLERNYDKNAWALNREVPMLMGPVRDEDLEIAADKLVETRTYVDELIKGTSNDDIIQLDSVGGTLLYMKASLIRQGINFPTSYVVGSTWSHEGWVGIETEGLCYLAHHLDGSKCFVLGGSHYVKHADRSGKD
ncbi:glycosyltransferase family 62 protein [Hypoxylon fragiforme]|uniref:glycosyltransferase family 62 protein n=1 Tax=Hypoxylon fragiforme TaxID=63214 RepID=UPI0020C60D7F|nr:glycosyltransferase family 62 protein [Hypoxylon fragiforme]KAI2605182.1 glycosyltransferase family 62 protein [Hypoxylon fragiforme]